MTFGSTMVAVNFSDSKDNSSLYFCQKRAEIKKARHAKLVKESLKTLLLPPCSGISGLPTKHFMTLETKWSRIANCKTNWQIWNDKSWNEKSYTKEAASNSHFGQHKKASRKTSCKLIGGQKSSTLGCSISMKVRNLILFSLFASINQQIFSTFETWRKISSSRKKSRS